MPAARSNGPLGTCAVANGGASDIIVAPMSDGFVFALLAAAGSPGLCEPCLAWRLPPEETGALLDQALERLWTGGEIAIGLAKCDDCSTLALVWRARANGVPADVAACPECGHEASRTGTMRQGTQTMKQMSCRTCGHRFEVALVEVPAADG